MCRVLKGNTVGEGRGFSIENSIGLQAAVDLAHQVDKWIDQAAIAPENAWNVFKHIKRSEIIDRVLIERKVINTKPAAKIVWLVKLKNIDPYASFSVEGIATTLATAQIYSNGGHWMLKRW